MKNILLISPDFPNTYWQFARAFKNNGMTVLAIGGTPEQEICQQLRNSVDKYVCCNEMENLQTMYNIVGCLINEFGPIDYLESNNEYWLQNDAKIREHFGINSGIYPYQLEDYQRKSSLKKYYQQAGIKVAPYLIVDQWDELEKFANKFGYPLFIKPDVGVGASGNYKIHNIDELRDFFHNKSDKFPYICETFVASNCIKTFDGIADINSDVVLCDTMIFPPSIFDVKKENKDLFYYVSKTIEPEFEQLGRKLIKTMGLKNRFFHGEFFVANNDCPGYFKKGDYIGIEVNIRTPGGYTPDLIDFAISSNIYQALADVVCFNKTNVGKGEPYYCGCASRRKNKQYFFTNNDIVRTFKNNICFSGEYPGILSDIMGDSFYMAKFTNINDMFLFNDYVERLTNMSYSSTSFAKTLLGEDARIMREQNEKSSSEESICDRHIDGA